MALMEFREPNQVKWVGSRPGHNGTQILSYESATNGTGVIYTVPAGYTFFLCGIYGLLVAGANPGLGGVFSYDAVPAIDIRLLMLYAAANEIEHRHMTYWPPVEIEAGYSLRSYSSAVGLMMRGTINGWIE